jgi:hypothetical protein
MINKLYKAQLAAKQAAINKARDNAISGYQTQIDSSYNTYQPMRNQADLQYAKAGKDLKETMAGSGTFNSGENVTANVGLNAAKQGAIGNINTQEATFISNLKKAIADAQANAEYDSAAAVSDTESAKLQAILNQANSDRDYGLSVAGLTGNLNGNRTLAGQQLDSSNNQWNQQFNYQQGRDAVADNQWNKTYNENVREFDINQKNWQQQFTYQQAQDAIQNQIARGQLSISQGNLALAKARLDAENDPNSLDNQIKRAQLNSENAQTDYVKAQTNALTNKTDNTSTTNQLKVKLQAISQDLAQMSPYDAYTEQQDNPSDYIQDIGIDNYKKLLNSYASIAY